jgi:hypothetical protein
MPKWCKNACESVQGHGQMEQVLLVRTVVGAKEDSTPEMRWKVVGHELTDGRLEQGQDEEQLDENVVEEVLDNVWMFFGCEFELYRESIDD